VLLYRIKQALRPSKANLNSIDDWGHGLPVPPAKPLGRSDKSTYRHFPTSSPHNYTHECSPPIAPSRTVDARHSPLPRPTHCSFLFTVCRFVLFLLSLSQKFLCIGRVRYLIYVFMRHYVLTTWKTKLSRFPEVRKRRGGWPGFEGFVWRRLTSCWILSAMSSEIQEWSHRSMINNLYLLTRPINVIL